MQVPVEGAAFSDEDITFSVPELPELTVEEHERLETAAVPGEPGDDGQDTETKHVPVDILVAINGVDFFPAAIEVLYDSTPLPEGE